MNTATNSELALVTGGSSGIGEAISRKLSEEGIKVIIADLAPPENNYSNTIFRHCDVSEGSQIDSLFSWITEEHGCPEYLILNAGQGIREKLCEGDPEKWQKVILTNLMGPLRCIRSFIPPMLDRRKGHIVFISSVASNQPHPYGGIYVASKTALEVVAETLRQETLPHLKVTVISPGIVDTNFFDNEISGEMSVEDFKMGAIQPEEIAEDLWYALNKKKGTTLNKIITRPANQNF